jgi:hypothetical protein
MGDGSGVGRELAPGNQAQLGELIPGRSAPDFFRSGRTHIKTVKNHEYSDNAG